MPRAENRKRPPNSLGSVSGSGFRGQSENVKSNAEAKSVKDNKQALLEKMKSLQEKKKNS